MKTNAKNFPIILLNLRNKYVNGMTDEELYAVTREAWFIEAKKRDSLKYAIAVYRGEVKGVFHILKWNQKHEGRWGFEGEVASFEICKKYVGKKYRMYGPIGYTE